MFQSIVFDSNSNTIDKSCNTVFIVIYLSGCNQFDAILHFETRFVDYGKFSNKRPGRLLNLGFLRGGAKKRVALIAKHFY